MVFPNKEITFPVPWDDPVLYFLGTLVDTDHIRDCATLIRTDLTALSELFLLPPGFAAAVLPAPTRWRLNNLPGAGVNRQ